MGDDWGHSLRMYSKHTLSCKVDSIQRLGLCYFLLLNVIPVSCFSTSPPFCLGVKQWIWRSTRSSWWRYARRKVFLERFGGEGRREFSYLEGKWNRGSEMCLLLVLVFWRWGSEVLSCQKRYCENLRVPFHLTMRIKYRSRTMPLTTHLPSFRGI